MRRLSRRRKRGVPGLQRELNMSALERHVRTQPRWPEEWPR